MKSLKSMVLGGIAAMGMMVGAAVPTNAHHSFAMFDGSQYRVFTGVVVRINPDANHLQIFFAPLDDERKSVVRDAAGSPVIWAVEMAGAAQAAQMGISVNGFAPGTIFSVGLHPLRNGQPGGDRGGSGLFKCPAGTPPAVGLHCDSIEASTSHGEGVLPAEGPLAEKYDPDA